MPESIIRTANSKLYTSLVQHCRVHTVDTTVQVWCQHVGIRCWERFEHLNSLPPLLLFYLLSVLLSVPERAAPFRRKDSSIWITSDAKLSSFRLRLVASCNYKLHRPLSASPASETMHFRIPQALDGFVAAVAGHVVSKPAFARAYAKTDLHSLQLHLRPQQARSQGYPDRQLVWSEDCCAEAYSMLCTVSQAGWPNRTLLLLLARFLSKVGAAVIQEATNGCTVAEGGNPSAPGGQPVEVSLGLTIFFTCQMLQHTEVCTSMLQKLLPIPLVSDSNCRRSH